MSSRAAHPSGRRAHALDRWSRLLMGGLAVLALALMLFGDHAKVRVQKFSWQEAAVGAEDRAFVLTFNRPMDTDSVEANLVLSPPLPGRISWAGRRMAYTLNQPIPYGESFQVSLPTARDRLARDDQSTRFEPFRASFRSRDRAFAYIGTEGEEQGRLVLVNLSQAAEPIVLTPPDLTVLDFEPYPLADRLLFSALPATAADEGPFSPTLYTVATGLTQPPPLDILGESPLAPPATDAVGTLTEVLPSDQYQNLAFDLAPDGHTLVVQRANIDEPSDFGPWIIRDGEDPRPLPTEAGGEFLIAPDSATLLMLQGQGTAIIPLDQQTDAETTAEPLDFLPEFGRVFDLTSDGRSAAMVDFNQNNPELRFTESLVLVNNQGEAARLLNVDGSILDAQFDPSDRLIYVLASRVLPGDLYQEQPTLVAINLEAAEPIELVTFAPQTQISLSVAPDGLALLVAAAPTASDAAPNADPASPQLWLVPPFQTAQQRLEGIPTATPPEPLPFTGQKPTWLP
jgi:dipeptidyl aminopeptidase/acylaminoacyl peptidase